MERAWSQQWHEQRTPISGTSTGPSRHTSDEGELTDLKSPSCRLQAVGDWYYGKWMKRFYIFYALLMVAAVITFGPICGVVAAGVLVSQQLLFMCSTSSKQCELKAVLLPSGEGGYSDLMYSGILGPVRPHICSIGSADSASFLWMHLRVSCNESPDFDLIISE